ncbi:DUF637 domain-containing protein, partial [Pseudomonas aeruginosa]|nr:DUF637 domain-containing protein [Pseudomonas aeruginosa]
MEQRGDVDWRRVQELHDSWKYSNSGLGVGAQLAIAIVVTYFTAGAASGAIATAGAGTSMAGATAAATATTSAGWLNAAGTAALSGMASNGAISTINNRGNLGDVVKDVTSSDALRGYVVAGTTAGLTAGVYDKWTSTQTGTSTALPNTGAVAPAAGLGTWQGVGQFTSNQLLQNGTSVLLDRALGGKGSLGDALQNSLANAFAAYGFKLIGDTTHGVLDDGSLGKIGLHALMGGLAAEAVGGDFRTGALAAGVNEALVDSLAKQYASLPIDDKKGLLTMSSQLIGMLAASTQGDADAKSLQTGAWVAGNATQHNYLSHWQEEKKRQEVDGCKDKPLCKTGIEAKWAIISAQQDVGIVVGVGGGIGLSTAETAVGVYELVKNWRETYAALEQLATSPEFRQQFGDNYLKGLEERAAFLTQAYEDAGWQGSVTAGVEGGRFAAELVGVLTAVKGGAQITAKLPTAAKNLVNAIAESPVSGSMSSQLGAVGDLGRLGGGAKGTATAGKVADEFIPPGMERPFRPVNPEFPPNKAVVDAMESPRIKGMTACDGTDCSEIASKLLAAAGGKGKVIEVRPTQRSNLNLYENGNEVPGQAYHQVYTDGRYVYDPRLSSQPIPKGDWERHIKGMNPDGVTISDKLQGLR